MNPNNYIIYTGSVINEFELLIYIFGNHYGSSFYQLNTPMKDIDKIKELVEDGYYSPYEIDKIIRKEINNG